MLLNRRILVSLMLAVVAGCATRRPAATPAPVVSPVAIAAATRAADPKAQLTLDQVEPKITALPAPATQPSDPPPLKAIELYAKARTAINENRRFGAISILKEAVAVDPYSSELRLALAQAQLGTAGY